MSDETRKLLGGYATGTLTTEEKDRLFAEALHDQDLFEALHDEEALRQVLEDPSARRQILEATDTPEFTIAGGLREWWDRPRGKVLAAALALTVITFSVRSWPGSPNEQNRQTQSAEVFREEPRAKAAGESPIPPPRTAAAPQKRSPVPADELAKRQESPDPRFSGQISSEPQMIASGPVMSTAPALSAPAALRSSAKEGLRWILQRRTADGQVSDASPETVFEAGDQVSVRVQSPAEGTLAVSTGSGASVFITPVSAGQIVAVPSSVTIGTQGEQRLSAVLMPLVPAASTGLTHFRAAESTASEQQGPKPVMESQLILRRK